MTQAHTQASPGSQPIGRLMAALLVGGITPILDATIVAIGLHTLTVALDAPVSTIQWVSTGYLLALAIAIPFVSWAQARFGSKRLWLFALGLFVLGSALCASAWNAPSLIAFRILQGFAGGIMFPLLQTIAMQSVPAESRTRTMANVSLPIALGPILGPVLGGIVLNWLDWRWLFLINVPIGIIGWILAAVFLTDDAQDRDAPRVRFDVFGAALLVPALGGLLYGLSKSYDAGGFGRPDVLIPCLGGAVLLIGFVVWAVRRAGDALVDVRLLAVRSVSVSSIALSFAGAVSFAGNFLLPLYFQALRGNSVLDAAFLLIPQGVGAFLARPVVGRLVDRYGTRAVSVGGFLLMAAATIPFAFADSGTSLWLLGTVLFLRGFGNGIVLIPVMTVAYVDISRDRMPHASAITRIVQQLGGAFGTALVAVVLTTQTTRVHPAAGFDAAFWLIVAFTVVAALAALLLPTRSATPARLSGGARTDGPGRGEPASPVTIAAEESAR